MLPGRRWYLRAPLPVVQRFAVTIATSDAHYNACCLYGCWLYHTIAAVLRLRLVRCALCRAGSSGVPLHLPTPTPLHRPTLPTAPPTYRATGVCRGARFRFIRCSVLLLLLLVYIPLFGSSRLAVPLPHTPISTTYLTRFWRYLPRRIPPPPVTCLYLRLNTNTLPHTYRGVSPPPHHPTHVAATHRTPHYLALVVHTHFTLPLDVAYQEKAFSMGEKEASIGRAVAITLHPLYPCLCPTRTFPFPPATFSWLHTPPRVRGTSTAHIALSSSGHLM